MSGVKALGSTRELRLILVRSNPGEVGGIPSVEVKFVEIGRNTGGESGPLTEH